MKSNERVLKSRNQREGKFLAGWCYNPAFKKVVRVDGYVKVVAKKRAGSKHVVVKVRMFNDNGIVLPGATFVRYYREGAFE